MSSAQHLSRFQAGTSLVNLFLGAGLLASPNAVLSASFIPGILAIGVTLYVVVQCLHMINICAQHIEATYVPPTPSRVVETHVDTLDYSDDDIEYDSLVDHSVPDVDLQQLAHRSFGKWGVVWTQLALVGSQTGFCVGFVSYIVTTLKYLYPDQSKEMLALYVSPVLFAVAQVRSLRHLAIPTLISSIVFSCGLVAMVVLCAQSGMSYKTIDIGNIQFNIHGISSCIGTVAYSFQCVGFILHVRNRMANKSEVKSVVSYVFTLGWFLYTIFPIIGLATFGALVQPVFTDNFKLTEFVRILLLTISLMLFIGFAQCLFPVSKLFDQWSDDLVQTRRYSLSHNVKRILCRTFLVAVVAVTVVLVPDFKFVVDVTGTVFNGLLGVILPCLWYMKLCNPFVHDMPTGFQQSLLANEDSEIVEIDEVPQHTFMDKVVFYGPPITYILFFASASVCILTYTILGEEEEV